MDTYNEVKTITYPGMVVRVHIPDISEAERGRRMEAIKKAAGKLLLDERGKRK